MNRDHPVDTGLPPERTSLAWGRTLLALVICGVLFVRWLPEHGWFAMILTGTSLAAALGIYLSQRLRYRRNLKGVRSGVLKADVTAVLWTTVVVVAVGAAGIYAVLFQSLHE
ncbi:MULTISPECIES: DUF202 domain-containing protein [unclassified Arthrobacter]|uniref:DUF202 domain-containing protein n=1 Tax=unclassified Arthrobacter TaxID=235627 RepID=UPI0002E9BA60|nr:MULTISPECIES: DUF202 domain-containing protein [unclassified Arthrobacter]PVE19129.1 DUF202 domain-containing protein [Arthrobacter sp. Bz4]